MGGTFEIVETVSVMIVFNHRPFLCTVKVTKQTNLNLLLGNKKLYRPFHIFLPIRQRMLSAPLNHTVCETPTPASHLSQFCLGLTCWDSSSSNLEKRRDSAPWILVFELTLHPKSNEINLSFSEDLKGGFQRFPKWSFTKFKFISINKKKITKLWQNNRALEKFTKRFAYNR